MLRILVVRLEGYVDTADAWSRGLRDEGHEVVVTGPDGPDGPDGEVPGADAVHAIATQEDVAVVVTPGAQREWAHAVKGALKEDDIELAPPECDLAELREWVDRQQDR